MNTLIALLGTRTYGYGVYKFLRRMQDKFN